MRVVAGSCSGRKLVTPEGLDTRPTSDRVREAVFNALRSLDALEGARVLDLFAGSGALGIEALSRGATHCTFVERNRGARDAIHENLQTLGIVSRADVVGQDVLTYLRDAPAFDLVLADPPYRFVAWDEVLGAIRAPLVVVESNRVLSLPAPWSTVREKRYGGTVVLIARCPSGQALGVETSS